MGKDAKLRATRRAIVGLFARGEISKDSALLAIVSETRRIKGLRPREVSADIRTAWAAAVGEPSK